MKKILQPRTYNPCLPTGRQAGYNKGFTIVELLVYMAVFAFISILVINMFLSISRAFVEIKANHELAQSSSAVLERMTREIKWANGIDGASTLGTSPSVLILNGTDSSGSARVATFNVSSSKVNFTENATSFGSLLTNNVTASNFMVRQITTTISSAVRIEVTLTFTRGSIVRTENFYTTVALRGGY